MGGLDGRVGDGAGWEDGGGSKGGVRVGGRGRGCGVGLRGWGEGRGVRVGVAALGQRQSLPSSSHVNLGQSSGSGSDLGLDLSSSSCLGSARFPRFG